MKPLQKSEIARNRRIRREEMARRTASSVSMMEYDKWIEGIKSSDSQFGKPGNRSPGAWSSRTPRNTKSAQFEHDEEFHWIGKREDKDKDTERAGSPTLWKKAPASENSYPTTRAEEIAVYRKEMMDMVRGLSEGDFELTLQDIVEKRKEFKEDEPTKDTTARELVTDEQETKKKKHQKKYVSVARSYSMDTGLLSKMLLPLSVVRRKSLNLRDRGEKVAPKEVEEKKEVVERKKTKDEEWWRKNEFSEKGSSNASSVGSSTSNDSHSSGDDHLSRTMSM